METVAGDEPVSCVLNENRKLSVIDKHTQMRDHREDLP